MAEQCDETGVTRIAEIRAELQKQKRAVAALTRKRKVADRARSSGSDTAWPFVVRVALVVWAMRSDANLAEAFLEEWPQNRRAVAPWSQEQLRVKMNTVGPHPCGEKTEPRKWALFWGPQVGDSILNLEREPAKWSVILV